MKTDRKSRNSPKAPLIASLALACVFVTGNAGASGIPVIDGAKIAQDITKYIKEAAEWVKTGDHYLRQYNDIMDRYTDPFQIFQAYQLQFAEDFKKKGIMDGVSERCGGGGDIPDLSELLEGMGLNPNGDIIDEQKRTCSRIVMLENERYNDQIDIMTAMLENAQKDIDRLTNQGRNSGKQGEMQSNDVAGNTVMSQIQLDAEKAKIRSELYDGMIGILKEQQKALALVALNGRNTPINMIADTAILKKALEVNE